MTSKRLENFAKRREYPFLTIHAGKKTQKIQDGSVTRQELKRSLLAIPMDAGLKYDPLFERHHNRARRLLEEFRPDVLHITGLNDVSILGAVLAWKMNLPMVGSWHTNLHEFSSHRLHQTLWFIPEKQRIDFIKYIENQILRGALLYYKMPQVLLAPNQELVDMLKKGTKREGFLMTRGVDTELFQPSKRTVNDNIYRLGFVGRLQPEKNVRLLADLEKELIAAGKSNIKFIIIGDGSERAWLEQNLRSAEFTGFISGDKLADAYANLDIFVFPSETDAFGNVVQEAFASGVPSIVANVGGPKYIVRHGETGYVAENLADFVKYSLELINDQRLLAEMRNNAREYALSRSWDSVFEKVYEAYAECRRIRAEKLAKRNLTQVAPLS